MDLIAHIGKIPVEEWLPFLVPVVALYLYGRRRDRGRREAVEQLPSVGEALDADTVALVIERWAADRHDGVSPGHVPLMYPPGPDGLSARELAERVGLDRSEVERRLHELAELGYLDLDDDGADGGADDRGESAGGPRVWLTVAGHDLAQATEAVLLARAR